MIEQIATFIGNLIAIAYLFLCGAMVHAFTKQDPDNKFPDHINRGGALLAVLCYVLAIWWIAS